MELKLESVSVKETVDNLDAIFDLKLEERNIRLITDDVHPNHFVIANQESLLPSVFSNLLTNVMKFSPNGSEVTISTDEYQNEKRVLIKDRGIGISQDRIKEIFNFGKRTTTTGLNGEKGTGFDLPIVKEMMELYGGRIEITSSNEVPSTGTIISLYFPIGKPLESRNSNEFLS